MGQNEVLEDGADGAGPGDCGEDLTAAASELERELELTVAKSRIIALKRPLLETGRSSSHRQPATWTTTFRDEQQKDAE